MPIARFAPSAPPLDVDLIRKYSISGPRYTSYPPATKFTADLAAVRLDEALRDDNAPGAGPISLYFHLPFCETRCWFCGCNTIITLQRGLASKYVEDLGREMRLTARRMNPRRPVSQIHLGGGTPTFLPPGDLLRLGQLIEEIFPNRTRDCEFGVEIDPRRLTEAHVAALAAIGANRASLGVQDTNLSVQLAVHRVQPQSQNQQAFRWLRQYGFRSINVDLICGLPLQTPGSFSRTVEEVLSLNPDRLSVFSYAHVPWIKPAQRILEKQNDLPSPDEKLAMMAVAHSAILDAGFVDIGLDHYARPGDPLAVAQQSGSLHRNFQGYSTQSGASLYGFGISSISSTPDTYRQNHKGLEAWRAALDRGELPVERGYRLTEEDRRRRIIIMRVMCDRALDYAALSAELGCDFVSAYGPELARMADLESDGLVKVGPDRLEVTTRGLPLLRIIAMRFDPTFNPAPQQHAAAI